MQSQWYQSEPATALIEALFKLDAIAATLEPFGPPHSQQFGGEDPVSIIGQLREDLRINSFGRGQRRSWSPSGSSATEACFNALGNVRSAWIEAHVGAKWATATQAECDALMEADEETASLQDAINAYVRDHADARRAA